MALVVLAHNAINAKLHNPTREISLFVSDLLTYQVEGFEHMTKRPGWDGRSSFYSFKTHSFPAGFVNHVKKALLKEGHMVRVVAKDRPEPLGPENPKVDAFGFDPRYEYQPDTVRRLVKHGMIIAQLATGAGKSRVARLAYARIKRKTLFLTTRSALLYQFRDACVESFGEKEVGVVGDGVWESDRPLVCGMVQTLSQRLLIPSESELIEKAIIAQSESEARKVKQLTTSMAKAKIPMAERAERLAELNKQLEAARPTDRQIAAKVKKRYATMKKQREETVKLLSSFEFVILEEAHEAGGNGYYDVVQACANAHYRLALTATPFMRQDGESNMRLMAVSGSIGIRVTEKHLIDLGILARPIFKITPTKKPPKMYRSTAYARAYNIGIVENDWRNKYAVAECIRMARYGLTSMILVQRKEHGERLLSLLSKVGLPAKFIKGENDTEERKKALAELGSGVIKVLIGTNILDVGVDVPSVGCIILAGGGKAEVATRQRIGRGLRAKKSGPNICFVLDFMDEHNQHLQSHALHRRAIITSTPGFVENILPTGSDWDVSSFGFVKAA